MKISKNSWHYKLTKWITPKEKLVNGELAQTNFCDYFGHLMALLFIGLPLFAVMAVLLSPALLWGWMEDKGWIKKPQEGRREPTTLFGKWFKAKKEKVCPVIEWTD
jgi:hypothetical protein